MKALLKKGSDRKRPVWGLHAGFKLIEANEIKHSWDFCDETKHHINKTMYNVDYSDYDLVDVVIMPVGFDDWEPIEKAPRGVDILIKFNNGMHAVGMDCSEEGDPAKFLDWRSHELKNPTHFKLL